MNIQNISGGRNFSLYLIKTVTHYSLIIQGQEKIDIIYLNFILYCYEYNTVFKILTVWQIVGSLSDQSSLN